MFESSFDFVDKASKVFSAFVSALAFVPTLAFVPALRKLILSLFHSKVTHSFCHLLFCSFLKETKNICFFLHKNLLASSINLVFKKRVLPHKVNNESTKFPRANHKCSIDVFLYKITKLRP